MAIHKEIRWHKKVSDHRFSGWLKRSVGDSYCRDQPASKHHMGFVCTRFSSSLRLIVPRVYLLRYFPQRDTSASQRGFAFRIFLLLGELQRQYSLTCPVYSSTRVVHHACTSQRGFAFKIFLLLGEVPRQYSLTCPVYSSTRVVHHACTSQRGFSFRIFLLLGELPRQYSLTCPAYFSTRVVHHTCTYAYVLLIARVVEYTCTYICLYLHTPVVTQTSSYIYRQL